MYGGDTGKELYEDLDEEVYDDTYPPHRHRLSSASSPGESERYRWVPPKSANTYTILTADHDSYGVTDSHMSMGKTDSLEASEKIGSADLSSPPKTPKEIGGDLDSNLDSSLKTPEEIGGDLDSLKTPQGDLDSSDTPEDMGNDQDPPRTGGPSASVENAETITPSSDVSSQKQGTYVRMYVHT